MSNTTIKSECYCIITRTNDKLIMIVVWEYQQHGIVTPTNLIHVHWVHRGIAGRQSRGSRPVHAWATHEIDVKPNEKTITCHPTFSRLGGSQGMYLNLKFRMYLIFTIIKTRRLLVVLVTVWRWAVEILTGWPVTVDGVSLPAADAERYRCACWLAGRGDGYQCGLNWGLSSTQ